MTAGVCKHCGHPIYQGWNYNGHLVWMHVGDGRRSCAATNATPMETT
ncbi:hypothetical protein [Prescottella equi]|nr:hypothetical protein [Prescottella equi]